ncbi:MAG: BMC domain-containing protein [Firmicutes bacterium]|nr:BMC domain-containing protein [Bacillota bacterium]
MSEKQRVIQEYVPGKQVTLLHLIAHPNASLSSKIGLNDHEAIGIVTITPGEGAIIAADVATKAAVVRIGFVDRFTGSLVISGDVSAVEAALNQVGSVLSRVLGFTSAMVTRS